MSLKSPLGNVLGLGSAKEGTEHWWTQRLTAVALVPLALWFFFSLVTLPALDYGTVSGWVESPLNAILLLLLAATVLYHSMLGTQVVIEDYVHGFTKVATLVVVRFIHIFLAVAAIFAILRVSLGSA